MNIGLIIWTLLYVYAQRKQELASHLNKQDYLDDAAMNMAEVMGTTGMYKGSSGTVGTDRQENPV